MLGNLQISPVVISGRSEKSEDMLTHNNVATGETNLVTGKLSPRIITPKSNYSPGQLLHRKYPLGQLDTEGNYPTHLIYITECRVIA